MSDHKGFHDAGFDTAPHELAAVLRLTRSGWSVPHIMRLLGKSFEQVQHEICVGLDYEQEAKRVGAPIVGDPTTPPVTEATQVPVRRVSYIRADDLRQGDEISGMGYVTLIRKIDGAVMQVTIDGKDVVKLHRFDELCVRRVIS